MSYGNLSDRTMLADISIGVWSGKKIDRSVSQEVITNHHASSDAGHFVKNIVPSKILAEIKAVERIARDTHYMLTFPGFTQRGPRILATAGYWEYVNRMNKIKSDFKTAVMSLKYVLPTIRQARKNELGSMWIEEQFPSAEEIIGMFHFDYTFQPMPESGNWILELDNETMDQLRSGIETEVTDALASAMKARFERVHEAVSEFAEKLSGHGEYLERLNQAGEDQDKRTVSKEGIFKSAALRHLHEFVEMLPCLNIDDDQRINDLIDDIKSKVLFADAEQLRSNDSIRNKVIKSAESIVADIDDWMCAA